MNIKSLAAAYGLPIDPSPLPEPGEGEVYYQYAYRALRLAWAGLILTAGVFFLGRDAFRYSRKHTIR